MIDIKFVIMAVHLYVFNCCSHFLVNSADRIIRVYDAKEILACGKDGDPEPMQRLQDLVNKYVSHLYRYLHL